MIRINKSRIMYVFGLTALFIAAVPIVAMATDSKPAMYATIWAVLPPIVAIGLALITKEVYSSLFIGILAGGLIYSGMNFPKFMNHVMIDGFVSSLSSAGNVGILVFLVILGMLVAMMNLSGGSAAFGNWAAQRIKTRRGAQYSTVTLGILIFVDDYFNCLTVGSVMKPLTDKYNISRAKLAYLIDATAAPVCILAPISSWAAAVSGFVEGKNGLSIFIQAIPYNFYALLTIAMMFMIITMNFDYGKMATYEKNAVENGDLFTVQDTAALKNDSAVETVHQGIVMDLMFPVIVLIISCITGMLYTGGFWSGKSFVTAFAGCDASTSLVLGSVVSLVITIVYYMIRRVVPFSELMECVPEGFKSMVSPILVLTMAWTLKTMTDSLGLAQFVANMMDKIPGGLIMVIPAMFFLVSCALGFASGTSWGTFGILIPIALAVTANRPDMMIVLISSCMAGGVCGDHCSPISDTTIMSSAGAAVRHLSHVETQLPYAMTVLSVSAVCYVIAGIMESPWVALAVGLVLLYVVLRFFKRREGSYVVDETQAIETATAQG
nr:Na+/H+ antiporter NhaC family protein [uncultured Mogibacterium sp.]